MKDMKYILNAKVWSNYLLDFHTYVIMAYTAFKTMSPSIDNFWIVVQSNS